MRPMLLLALSLCCFASDDIPISDIVGLYATESEIGGYAATKPHITTNKDGEIEFEKTFRSDVIIDELIKQDPIRGKAKYIGSVLFVTEPGGFVSKGSTRPFVTVEEYHPVKINDNLVLVRKDGYQSWSKNKSVYDYGILVQVRKTLAGE